jgi:VWFA-related protein
MSACVVPALLPVAIALLLTLHGPGLAARPTQRSALVTVVATAGAPLRQLTAHDFVVKEDGKKAEVTEAVLAKDPLSVALLIDLSQPARGAGRSVQNLRSAAAAFVRAIHAVSPEAQIALVSFAQSVRTVVDFTDRSEELTGAISQLLPDQQTVAVLLEAILESGNKLTARPAPRRAMVTIDFDAPEGSPDRMVQQAADAISNSGATLWAVSVRGTAPSSANREELLNTMTKASGGQRFSTVDATGLEGMLKNVAASLTSQYTVTFTRARDGAVKSTTFETVDGRKVLLTPFMR